MTKKEAITAINSEIKWCEANPMNLPQDWRNGFIEGLKQAKRIIRAYPTADASH